MQSKLNNKNVYLATLSAGLASLCGYRMIHGPITNEYKIAQIERGKKYFKLVEEGLNYTKNWQTIGLSFDPETIKSLNALEEIFFVTKEKKSKPIKTLLKEIKNVLDTLESPNEINTSEIREVSNFFSQLSNSVRYNIKRNSCRMLN